MRVGEKAKHLGDTSTIAWRWNLLHMKAFTECKRVFRDVEGRSSPGIPTLAFPKVFSVPQDEASRAKSAARQTSSLGGLENVSGYFQSA